ncbi:hypothetical protein LTR70_010019 [Exophiala xenobiotica]|uniref:DUF6594 domain-containing protein n=1 Tax=Lithohypha guttulata TaxID=1690604 RepID=A0ABR0JX65_9EURO|nr:hypothetical protein LTR24_009985 [Lithohypha guttulata]KAK5309750.1 hypothetical protein LTR70_010019 [Exophiala xenobiotica]
MPAYEQLAVLTSRFPELLIIRRFDYLSARVILALQADLQHLEKELKQYIELDEKNLDLRNVLASWGEMCEAVEEGQPILQVRKMQQIQDKLKTYHETILRISQVQQLSSPSKQNRSRLWTWLSSPDGGDNFLTGIEADPWDADCPQASSISRDLSVLKAGPDRLDSWLADSFIPKWHLSVGHRFRANVAEDLGLGRLWEYDMKALHLSGNVICVLLSSLAPIVSIQTLYWIPNTLGRLIAITGFVLIFAALMMFVSECRRFEVFAATAAFAAVQVVFLQGLSGSINCS